jgi:chromosome segregation ATPase
MWALLLLLPAVSAARLYAQAANPAVDRVVTMLGNLMAEVEAEQAADDSTSGQLKSWCGTEVSGAEKRLETLRTNLESLAANLASLKAQREELSGRVEELSDQVETMKTQLSDAQEKRSKEEAAFVAEQQDFEQSIAACTKAVEILKQHYGDGSAPASTRPAWMSLLEVQQSVARQSVAVSPALAALLQQAQAQPSGGFFGKKPGFHDQYESKTDEGLGIVSQMGVLRQTFMDDKQAAIDEENRLQQAFQQLMAEKTAQLEALVQERDAQQAQLNQVQQEIGEKEQQQANFEQEAKDEEAYLATVQQQCADGEAIYEQRTKDRSAEKTGISEAMGVLQQGSAAMQAVSFMQLGASRRAEAPSFLQLGLQEELQDARSCRNCPRAAAVLTEAARRSGSELLATAAAVAGSAALQEVLQALNEMLQRLAEEADSEEQHKKWCDEELAATNAKKQEHESAVADLKAISEDLSELIVEKQQALTDNQASIDKADSQFQEQTKIRQEEHQEFGVENAHYADAISAIGQAVGILERAFKPPVGAAALVQAGQAPPQFAEYSSKAAGGMQAVQILQQLGQEFQESKAHAEAMEKAAEEDYQKTSQAYQQARRDLLDAKDSLTAQLQSAQEKLDQTNADIESGTQQVAAADEYLGKLGQSSGALLTHYEARVTRRKEEKQAITEAIAVLSAQ